MRALDRNDFAHACMRCAHVGDAAIDSLFAHVHRFNLQIKPSDDVWQHTDRLICTTSTHGVLFLPQYAERSMNAPDCGGVSTQGNCNVRSPCLCEMGARVLSGGGGAAWEKEQGARELHKLAASARLVTAHHSR